VAQQDLRTEEGRRHVLHSGACSRTAGTTAPGAGGHCGVWVNAALSTVSLGVSRAQRASACRRNASDGAAPMSPRLVSLGCTIAPDRGTSPRLVRLIGDAPAWHCYRPGRADWQADGVDSGGGNHATPCRFSSRRGRLASLDDSLNTTVLACMPR
jgi:hypothetical protein